MSLIDKAAASSAADAGAPARLNNGCRSSITYNNGYIIIAIIADKAAASSSAGPGAPASPMAVCVDNRCYDMIILISCYNGYIIIAN